MALHIEHADLFLPVMARILSALMVMPIFGHRSVPAPAKIGLAGVLAWLVIAPGGLESRVPGDLSQYLLGLMGEVAIGLLLGFAGSLPFWALSMAGELVGQQIGWNFGSTLHPSFESSAVPTGQFYSILGTLIFFSIGGHQQMLTALARTFAVAPPCALAPSAALAGRAVELTAGLFAGAIQMALPILGTLMLTEAVLAFLARMVPQLNAWVFGMPLKVAVGLITLWIGLPAVLVLVRRWVLQSPHYVLYLVK